MTEKQPNANVSTEETGALAAGEAVTMSAAAPATQAPAAAATPAVLAFANLEESVSSVILNNPYVDPEHTVHLAYGQAVLLLKAYELRGEFGNAHSTAPLTSEEVEGLRGTVAAVNAMVLGEAACDEGLDPLADFIANYGQVVAELKIPYEPLRDYVRYGSASAGDPYLPNVAGPRHVREGEDQLLRELLKLEPGCSVLDLDCGDAKLLASLEKDQPGARLTGFERFAPDLDAALLRASCHPGISCHKNDLLSVKAADWQADRVYMRSCSGLGLTPENLSQKPDAARLLKILELVGQGTAASQWFHVFRVLDFMAEGATGFAMVPLGATRNSSAAPIRKALVDAGMLKGVISFPRLSLGECCLVLGKNSGSVTFVDATDLQTKDWRYAKFAEKDARLAAERYLTCGPNARQVQVDQIRAAGYCLDPSAYTQAQITLENALTLGDLAQQVFRGAALGAKELDALSSAEQTDVKYLRIADISDGQVTEGLPCLTHLDPKHQKCCVVDGDVLVTKSGSPFKVALAQLPKGKTVVATGNLYVVRADPAKVNPAYLAAFLQSQVGLELLKRASTGSAIRTLAVSELKGIQVPVPSMAQQEKVAQRYLSALEQIAALKAQVTTAKDQLATLFGTVE